MTKYASLILEQILACCTPARVILYNIKRSVSGGKVRALDFCIVTCTDDKNELLRTLYRTIDSPIPVNLLVYTCAEWDEQCSDPGSYACVIAQKGTVLYEPTP